MSNGNGIGGTDSSAKFHPVFAAGGNSYGMTAALPQETLSFIEDGEKIQAQSVIDQQFRELTKSKDFPEGVTFQEHARLTRYFCAVKIYVRPEELKTVVDSITGEKKVILLPDTVRAEDRYQSCAGLVVALGPQAFKDKDGTPKRETFRVGDWIVFPRTDIIRIDFCGVPLGVMTDDRAVIVTDDPTYWTQGSLTFKA